MRIQPHITDDTPLRIGELARHMRISKNTIHRDRLAGYVFEFATHHMTTPGHFKAWLRQQAHHAPSQPRVS